MSQGGGVNLWTGWGQRLVKNILNLRCPVHTQILGSAGKFGRVLLFRALREKHVNNFFAAIKPNVFNANDSNIVHLYLHAYPVG